MWSRRRNKFGAIRTTRGGVSYASKAEAARAACLDGMVRAGTILGYARQVPFTLGCPENRYVVDFLVFWPSGQVHAEDVKGVETAKFRHDVKLWAAYGLCPLVIVRRSRRGGTSGWMTETVDRGAGMTNDEALMTNE